MLNFKDPADWFAKMSESICEYPVPHLPSTSIAFDVGANVGAFTVAKAPLFKHIYCVEAASETANRCQQNLHAYHIANATVFNLAAAKEDNQIVHLKRWQNFADSYSGNASILNFVDPRTEHRYDSTDGFEEVKSISLKGLMALTNTQQVDYLKVDIEGGEFDFLYGQDLSNIKYIAMELHVQLGFYDLAGQIHQKPPVENRQTELIKWIEQTHSYQKIKGDGIETHIIGYFKNKTL